jgi:hypothetical protein
VAKELGVEGHQFCIEAIVFCDQLNDQAKNSLPLIMPDGWLIMVLRTSVDIPAVGLNLQITVGQPG